MFDDMERSESLLNDLITPLIGSVGENYEPEALRSYFLEGLLKSPDPDGTLINLHRVVNVSFGYSLLHDLLRYPALYHLLINVCSYSQYMTDILVRYPELFRWLTTPNVLSNPKSKDVMLSELISQTDSLDKYENKLNAVRRYHRRETLRLGIRDLLGEASLVEIMKELSALADAVSEIILRIVLSDFGQKYGEKPSTPFAIIAVGKLGGEELNYSSDIDLIFVAGNDEEFYIHGGRKMTSSEFYHRIADRWIREMTAYTPEGALYRVDTRLRPDGNSGPLVPTYRSYMLYYESRGELWERQMLIKARPIAGDLQFGAGFLKDLQSFIYPATFFESPRETISRIKKRIEKAVDDELNIKLMRGGIRDVEFIVQALQLLNGRRISTLRTGSTLEAIRSLMGENLINAEEGKIMREAYKFFRILEHRLQMEGYQQIHTLPADEKELKILAGRMEFHGDNRVEQLMEQISAHRSRVEKIFNDVFGREGDDTDTGSIPEFNHSPEVSNIGFSNIAEAKKLWRQLERGISSEGIGGFDIHTKELFRQIAPSLINDFSNALDPDRGLKNFLNLVRSYPLPASFYTVLRNDAIRKIFVTICSASNRLTSSLSNYPEDIELLVARASQVIDTQEITDLLSTFRQNRFLELCAHIRFLMGRDSIEKINSALSFIAKRRITEIYHKLSQAYGFSDPPFVVAVLGKLGGNELGLDGDLDLIFLADEIDGYTIDMAEDFFRSFIKECARGEDGMRGYNVDLRLRPEGESGPFVITLKQYKEYLERRSAFWERHSLIKGEVILGHQEIQKAIKNIFFHHVYERDLPDDWTEQILSMRKKTEKRTGIRRREIIDVKLSPGGIMDIEFTVNAFQLKYGKTESRLRSRNTLNLLDELGKGKFLSDQEIAELRSAYCLYREIEYFNRLYLDIASNEFPSEDNSLDKLTKFSSGGADSLKNFYESQRKIREIYLKNVKNLA